MSQPCLPIPRYHPKRKRRRNSKPPKEDATNTTSATFGNIDSMDASEYLLRVVQQAKGLPDVFVSQEESTPKEDPNPGFVPIDGSAASLSYLLSGRTQLIPPPSVNHLPQNCNRWMDQSIASFEYLRHYLTTCKEQGIGGKKTARLAFPGMKEQEGWLTFCLGPNWNVTKKKGGNGDKNDKTTLTELLTLEGQSIPLWRRDIPVNGHDPSVRIILQMDQVLLRRVLSHMGQFLCTDLDSRPCERRHSDALKWTYSLLARLEFPIHRDDAAMLYQLLKALTRARSRLVLPTNTAAPSETTSSAAAMERKQLAGWNLLIVLIGVFFEQGGNAASLTTCAN